MTVRSSLAVDLSQLQASLRRADQMTAVQDRRAAALRERLRQQEAEIARANQAVERLGHKLGHKIFKKGVKTAVAFGLGEIGEGVEDELAQHALQGLIVGGPKGAAAAVGIHFIKEGFRLLKEGKKEREDFRREIANVQKRIDAQTAQLMERIKELDRKYLQALFEFALKEKEFRDDLSYRTAAYLTEAR